MARMSGAGEKICYRKSVDKRPARGRVFTRICESAVRDHHTIDYHLALVDGRRGEPGFRPEIPAATSAQIDRLLAGSECAMALWWFTRGRRVMRNTGRPIAGQRWSITWRSSAGCRWYVTGSPDAREQVALGGDQIGHRRAAGRSLWPVRSCRPHRAAAAGAPRPRCRFGGNASRSALREAGNCPFWAD